MKKLLLISLVLLLPGSLFGMRAPKKNSSPISGLSIRNFGRKRDKAFLNKAYKKNYDNLVGGIGNSTPLKSIVEERYQNDTIKVLFHNAHHAGFIAFSKKGEINALYVHRDFRGRGFAKCLMSAAQEELLKLNKKRITLEVFDYNKAALKLFKQSGFKKKKQSGHLITMTKSL